MTLNDCFLFEMGSSTFAVPSSFSAEEISFAGSLTAEVSLGWLTVDSEAVAAALGIRFGLASSDLTGVLSPLTICFFAVSLEAVSIFAAVDLATTAIGLALTLVLDFETCCSVLFSVFFVVTAVLVLFSFSPLFVGVLFAGALASLGLVFDSAFCLVSRTLASATSSSLVRSASLPATILDGFTFSSSPSFEAAMRKVRGC